MGQPRRDLAFEARTDVDVRVGRAAGEKPDVSDRMGCQTGSLVLRESQSIARQWIHRVKGSAADNAVIPMAEICRQRILWVMGEKNFRAPTSNPENEIAAQGAGVLDLAVRVAEEDDRRETQPLRRRTRLCLAP